MKKLLATFGVGIGLAVALAAWGAGTALRTIPMDIAWPTGGNPQSLALPYGLGFLVNNASSTGTTVSKLAKLTGTPSTAVIAATSDTTGIIGVVVGGAGTTGQATVVQVGFAQCIFDNSTTAGHYVGISSTFAGECHDNGTSLPSGQLIGTVTTSGSATQTVMLGGASGVTAIVPTVFGGLGINAGSSTGVPSFSSGAVTINAQLTPIFGGLGASFAAANGVVVFSSGSANAEAQLAVASGGTAAASFTAYAPICGGTTTTGAFQPCGTGIGTSGWVLTSNGTSALPTFQAAAPTFSGLNVDGVMYAATSSTVGSTAVGSAGQIFTSNGSGNAPTYQSQTVQAKSGNYTTLAGDDLVTEDATSGAVTVTLIGASSAVKPISVCKLDSSAHLVTISRGGSDTIQSTGATVTTTVLHRQGECLKLASDTSSKWYLDQEERYERVTIGNGSGGNCTAGTCTEETESGNWISSVTLSANAYTVNIVSGIFSAVPTCVCTAVQAAVNKALCSFDQPTTTAISTLQVYNISAISTATTGRIYLVCHGPR